MRRINQEEKIKIKELIEKGASLRNVQKITKLPLSTIQYHSPKKSKGRTKDITKPKSNFIKGELIGAFAGDGSTQTNKKGRSRKYYIRYFLSYEKDQDYANYLEETIKKMRLNPKRYIKKYKGNNSSIEIRTSSIRFLEFIKDYLLWEGKKGHNVRLKRHIKDYDKKFLLGFSRGLMDTDGFVEEYNVSLGVISKQLITNFQEILDKFSIPYKKSIRKRENRKDLHLIRIKKEGLRDFKRLIGFSNIRKQKEFEKIIRKIGAARI